jgi:hypothetical protein
MEKVGSRVAASAAINTGGGNAMGDDSTSRHPIRRRPIRGRANPGRPSHDHPIRGPGRPNHVRRGATGPVQSRFLGPKPSRPERQPPPSARQRKIDRARW